MNSMTTKMLDKAKALSPVRLITTLMIATSLTACGGLGSLASNPRVSDADNDQVIFIGDSIFALSGKIQDVLEDYAGETFRSYTLSGAEITGGILATSIEDQFSVAVNDNANIDTVIMDGAGNDILIPAILFDPNRCKTYWWQWGRLSSKCKSLIKDLQVEATNLLNTMGAQGVDNVIYLGYYHTKNALFRLDSLEESSDYGGERLSLACRNSNVSCKFVDPRSVINDSDIIFDGIHPTTSGSIKMANLLWPELQSLL